MAVVQIMNQKSTSRVKQTTYKNKIKNSNMTKINNTKMSVSQVSDVRECKAE